jgi:hypothetical protein
VSDDDFPVLICGMCFVGKDSGQRIVKDGVCFIETDAVLRKIVFGLLAVSFNAHKWSIAALHARCQENRDGFRPGTHLSAY